MAASTHEAYPRWVEGCECLTGFSRLQELSRETKGMDMFARKTLHQLAVIATLGSMGATALADFDCFELLNLPAVGSGPFYKDCPASGSALVELAVTGGGNQWRLTVTDVRAPTLVDVWVTAFLFDQQGNEIPACNIHPSETLDSSKPTTTSVTLCNRTGLSRPAYATVYAAED